MVLLFAQFSKFMLILYLTNNISSCASVKNALGKLLMDQYIFIYLFRIYYRKCFAHVATYAFQVK